MKFRSCVISLLLVLVILFTTSAISMLPICAYNEYNYEEIGYDFLLTQYELKNIEYENMEKRGSINLYDFDNRVIAKMMIVDRDGYVDYVVLNFIVDRVDEYGFNQSDFIAFLESKEQVYYAGAMNYAYYEEGVLFNGYEEIIDKNSFEAALSNFLSTSTPQAPSLTPYLSYSNVQADMYGIVPNSGLGGSIDNTAWKYLSGIYTTGVHNSLSFQDQAVLNSNYATKYGTTVSGTCAVVAIVNMLIYYEYLGFEDAIFSDDIDYTFNIVMTELDWNNWTNLSWWDKTVSGMKSIAERAGYEYDMTAYPILTWNNIVSEINSGNLIWTYIDNNNVVAHAVVTVGYEEFTHTYTTTEEYWLLGWHERVVEHSDEYRYLRVIDGWSSSNSSRYVDFNGYFTTVMGIAFMLEE